MKSKSLLIGSALYSKRWNTVLRLKAILLTVSRNIYYFLLFVLVLLVSCKKNPVKPAPPSSIEIGGQTYGTFKTGNQEWLISNYKGPGGVPFNAANSKPEYGMYYSRAALQAIVLPQGWRIPTKNDYIKMGEAEGITFVQDGASRQEKIKSLTSKNNWRTVPGTNLSGFNAYPGGYIFRNSNPDDGDIAEFWTADGLTFSIQEIGNENALRIGFYNNSNNPEYRFNVRFVRDL